MGEVDLPPSMIMIAEAFGCSILEMEHMFIMRLRLGVIAFGVKNIVSLSSATEGALLLLEDEKFSIDTSSSIGEQSLYTDFSSTEIDLEWFLLFSDENEGSYMLWTSLSNEMFNSRFYLNVLAHFVTVTRCSSHYSSSRIRSFTKSYPVLT